MRIVVLEDNKDRQAHMRECLHDRFHQHESVFFERAQDVCAYLESNLSSTLLISLDHDLELQVGGDGKLVDAGTGREAAEFLATHEPCCPIVIHTTNTMAGDSMEFLLREAEWDVHRVHPFGDTEWIFTVWFRTVRDAIVATAKRRVQNPSQARDH